MLLALPPIPPEYDLASSGWVTSNSVGILSSKKVEPAGTAYHAYQRARLGMKGDVGGKIDAGAETKSSGKSSSKDADAKKRAEWEEKNKNASSKELEENLYEVLGIGHLGFNASAKQIKRAYQKMLLKLHPDKQGISSSDSDSDGETDPAFLRLQNAWEILSNPERRRGYDSQFDFDDAVPSATTIESWAHEKNGEDRFYAKLGDVFERNARFSVKKPVPHIGDATTSLEDVRQFYKFWVTFETWRDFSSEDEFKNGDLETAESREEKRWMMNKNKSNRAKLKKKEYSRISGLVEAARKHDPRLVRARDAEKKRKAEAKAARAEAKRLEEERKRLEEERKRLEEERKVEEAAAAKKAAVRKRQKIKKEIRKKKKIIRTKWTEAAETLSMAYTDIDVEAMFEGMSELSEYEDLVAKVSDDTASSDGAKACLEALFEMFGEAQKQAREAVEKARHAAVERRLKAERLEAERKANSLANKHWHPTALSLLSKAIAKFPGGSRNRWETIANFVNMYAATLPGWEDRTKEHCIAKAKELQESNRVAKAGADIGSKDAAFKLFKSQKSDSGENNPANADAWQESQQKQLEEALRTFGSTMEKNERWRCIAKAVNGKTKKECVARYKELRAQLKKKRAAAAAARS